MSDILNFEQLVYLCRNTHEEIQKRAARAMVFSLVVRNWLFGHYIVEYEQNGEDRAAYGVRLLEALVGRLRTMGVKGASSTNLKLARQFYCIFRQIGQTASDPFNLPQIRQTLSDELFKRRTLGSHCVTLLNGQFKTETAK